MPARYDIRSFFIKALTVGALMLSVCTVQAQTGIANPDEVEAIRQVMLTTQQGMVIDAIEPSPIPGMYEVHVQNGPVIYASADARYFIPGDLYAVTPRGLVNLGEEQRSRLRAEKIAALDESDMIIFPASTEEKAVLTVFTDVDCQYCRRLHTEMPQLNELGITVRYLAFPRTGLDTETYYKMVSIWCADSQQAIFTSATRGGAVPVADCANPVAEQYQIGREVGVTGTPTLIFEDGTSMPGYVPAETLAAFLLGNATAGR